MDEGCLKKCTTRTIVFIVLLKEHKMKGISVFLYLLVFLVKLSNADELVIHDYIDVLVDKKSLPYFVEYKFTVNNRNQESKKIRINHALPKIVGKKFIIDRKSGCILIPSEGNRTGPGIPDGIVNLKAIGINEYALDIQFDQPKGIRDFCISIFLKDMEPFVSEPDSMKLSFTVDKEGSPLDNPIVYNYMPRKRFVDWQTDSLEENIDKSKSEIDYKLAPNRSFKGISMKYDLKNKETHLDTLALTNLIDLNVPSFGGIKDTRMLMAGLGGLADYYHWNESTFDGNMFIYADNRSPTMGRCWAIGVFNIYNYYYGNRNTKSDALTQDEMVYLGKVLYSNADSQFGMFTPGFSEGLFDASIVKMINAFMYESKPVLHNQIEEPLSINVLENHLKTDKPLFISISTPGGGHFLLIDGIAKNNVNDTLVHLINTDNFGTENYMKWNDLLQILTSYITYDKPTGYAKTDSKYRVDFDYDNDGIVDFDEQYRFKTAYNEVDSDNDGISDFHEIYSYVVRSSISDPTQFIMDIGGYLSNLTLSSFLNFDYSNDNSFPQINYDFDGDGVADGDEDKNHNGIYERELGETDPLVHNDSTKQKHKSFSLDNIAVYAFGNIYFGPNLLCFNDAYDNYACNIVSENTNERYSVFLDDGTVVNSVITKGGVFEGSKTQTNAVVIFGRSKDSLYVVTDKDYPPHKLLFLNPSAWNYHVDTLLPAIKVDSKNKIVKKGEKYELKDGDSFSLLQIDSGATLAIGEGTFYIGDIKLDTGSVFTFTNKIYGAIMHVNGFISWKGVFDEDTPHPAPNAPASSEQILASGFKIIQHSDKGALITSKKWFGTVFAPFGTVVLSSELSYGQFFVKDIEVGIIGAELHNTVYSPSTRKKDDDSTTYIETPRITIEGDLKINGVSRNNISFEISESGTTQIHIFEMSGREVAALNINTPNAGYHNVNWDGSKLNKGIYVISIKHNRSVRNKMFHLK